MGIMHKEIIEQRRDKAIVLAIIFASVMIGLAKFVGGFKFFNYKLEYITDPIFILTTLIILYIAFRKTKTSYKYSIVSDRLLIHRINSKEQRVLENIKLDRIVYFGNEKNKVKDYKGKQVKKYICKLLSKKAYCCVYENEGNYNKFYFQPSNEFIKKINNYIDR
ncbi:MAG: hypothetical protein ACRDD2_03420 [Sarcina sp.]